MFKATADETQTLGFGDMALYAKYVTKLKSLEGTQCVAIVLHLGEAFKICSECL